MTSRLSTHGLANLRQNASAIAHGATLTAQILTLSAWDMEPESTCSAQA
jgi:hypothetical protein